MAIKLGRYAALTLLVLTLSPAEVAGAATIFGASGRACTNWVHMTGVAAC
jgi:hypothetical protein